MDFVPVVKPVGGHCNLNCSYCYFRQKESGKISQVTMSNETLKSFIDIVCGGQLNNAEFVWHGGEPMLAGIDFYRQVVELEAEWINKGKKIFNSIQTNGTLIDQQWLSFFAENQFVVGISLDGPAEFHNQTRKTIGGSGSFEKVITAVRLLQEAGVLSDVICCVSSANCDYPEVIFDFFIGQGMKRLKFLQVQGRDNQGNLLPYSVTGEQYADFLLAIFKQWLKLDDPTIEIREIKSVTNLLLGGDFRECMFAGECYKYFTVYPDGSVYGCDSLPKVEALRFGYITDGLDKIESSPNFIRFREQIEHLKKRCRLCEWFDICRGGCLQDWWPDIFNPSTRNLFCRGLKRIFATIRKTLEEYQMV